MCNFVEFFRNVMIDCSASFKLGENYLELSLICNLSLVFCGFDV